MKKIIIPALILCASMLYSCKQTTSGENPEIDSEENESTLNGGSFLMYYYPTHSMYGSSNGKEFSRKDTCIGYPNVISADAAGTLFSPVYGKKIAVTKSVDGGKTWLEVTSTEPEGVWASYVITAGAVNTVYALSSNGSFHVSKDGGVNWEKRTTPCGKDTVHSSPATGMEAWLTVSSDGKKLLAQAWYFEESVLSVSEDEGKTWKAIVAPTERNSSRGIGFCGARIVYASYDQVFTSDDNGATWIVSSPANLYSANSVSSYYGYRHFITDGEQCVVGVEVPGAETSRDEKNKYPGAIFVSTDGGKTFEVKPFPHSVDPTPTSSDEYVWLTFLKKK